MQQTALERGCRSCSSPHFRRDTKKEKKKGLDFPFLSFFITTDHLFKSSSADSLTLFNEAGDSDVSVERKPLSASKTIITRASVASHDALMT